MPGGRDKEGEKTKKVTTYQEKKTTLGNKTQNNHRIM